VVAPADVHDLVIDVHAHVFNAWDLPLAGFIRKTRPALGPVASVMTRLVRERSVRDRAGQVVPDAESGTCLMDLRESGGTLGDCSDDEAQALFEQILTEDPQLQADNGEIRSRGLNPASWVETASTSSRPPWWTWTAGGVRTTNCSPSRPDWTPCETLHSP
jgi:hypothetical protein